MSLVRVQFGEFKRSASREADRLVYRLTREKPPAGASWRGLCALAFVERSQGSHRNGGQTAVSAPRAHGLSELVNSSPRSGGRSERGQGPGCGLSVARADFRARLPFGDGFPGAGPGTAIEHWPRDPPAWPTQCREQFASRRSSIPPTLRPLTDWEFSFELVRCTVS